MAGTSFSCGLLPQVLHFNLVLELPGVELRTVLVSALSLWNRVKARSLGVRSCPRTPEPHTRVAQCLGLPSEPLHGPAGLRIANPIDRSLTQSQSGSIIGLFQCLEKYRSPFYLEISFLFLNTLEGSGKEKLNWQPDSPRPASGQNLLDGGEGVRGRESKSVSHPPAPWGKVRSTKTCF